MNIQNNKANVIKSAIVAKAIAWRVDHYEAIVVHEASTQYEFYWVYTLRSRKTARKNWKFSKTFARDLSPRDWRDFDSFLAHYQTNYKAEFFPRRISKSCKMALLALTQKVALTPSIDPRVSMQVMWKMKDAAKGDFGTPRQKVFFANAVMNDHDKYITHLVPPENEVWVYHDECPHCGQTHMLSHYPGNRIVCADLQKTRSNPALYYGGFRNGKIGNSHGMFVLYFKQFAPLSRSTANSEAFP